MKISRRQIRKILINESLRDSSKKPPRKEDVLSESDRARILVRKLLRESLKNLK